MKICIYCGSSNRLAKNYHEMAETLGNLLAEQGHTLIYGGSNEGLMGTLSQAARKKGAKIIGIIPEIFEDQATEFDTIVADFPERLAAMDKHADAFIALPGGLGTGEEVMRLLVAKQLKRHEKPFIFVNTNNFFEHLFAHLERTIQEQFSPKDNELLWKVATTPQEALDYLDTYVAPMIAKRESA